MQPAEPNSQRDFNFQELFYDSPLAIYACDQSGNITFFNKAAESLWGVAPAAGKNLWCGSWKTYYLNGRPMPPEHCPTALAIKEGKVQANNEIMIERPDHTFRNLLVFPTLLFDNNAVSTGAYTTLVDISEQKRDEEKQSILAAIVESSDDAIISKNLNGIITSWNRGAQKVFGYTEEEIIGKPISVLIPKALLSEENVIIQNIKSGNKVNHFQTVRITKSGKRINVSITVSPLKDRQGYITGASKIARDITDQLQKAHAIKQNAQRLEILNRIAKDIAGNLDTESILQRITDATTQITGAAFGAFFFNSVEESGESVTRYTLSGTPKDVFEKSGIPGNTALFNATFEGTRVVRSDDITNDSRYGKNTPQSEMPNAQLALVSYLAVPVITATGKVLGRLFFGHSGTGVFTAEHEDLVVNIAAQASVALDNSRLFEEVKTLSTKKDEFIALASHELKTPITTIKGYLQILQKNVTDNVGHLFLEKSLRQVNKLNSLISDLFDISKIEAGKLQLNYELFDLHALVTDIIETLRYSTSTHRVILEDAGADTLIEADKQRIEQVLVNLLTNSIKYSPASDTVFVQLLNEKNGTSILVKDTGMGLSPEQVKNIFTRFYRVEGNLNISGLGLGLYLSKEIVERHGGRIAVKSEPDVGSEFAVFLPASKPV